MSLNLNETVLNFLQQNPEQRFTAREIATWIFETYPDECREKQQRSTATVNPLDSDAALVQQLCAEIGSQRPRLQNKYPNVKTTEGRPRKYYYTEQTDSAEIDEAEEPQGQPTVVREHDLYPLLTAFLRDELNIYSKRIDERRSTNNRGPNGNKWLYPDLVGMEDLSADWDREIRDCVKLYADKKTKLWSFEVKVLVNGANVREVFFQAVSNSSWANYAYLVASEIGGADTLKELRILAGLHGIGFIRLDAGNPSESQIMIPAKERAEVDWDTANRLAKQNKDFIDYIKLVRQFYQTGDIRQTDWDGY
jgi:hypothetical protein